MYFNSIFGVYGGDKYDPGDLEATAPQLSAYQAIVNAAIAAQAASKSATDIAALNPVIQYLGSHTPAECIAKVNTDVTDLASAKIMLGHFAVALCVLVRDKLRG
jgi:hypothetical protein